MVDCKAPGRRPKRLQVFLFFVEVGFKFGAWLEPFVLISLAHLFALFVFLEHLHEFEGWLVRRSERDSEAVFLSEGESFLGGGAIEAIFVDRTSLIFSGAHC